MITKEQAITNARKFAERSGKYALYSEPYGDLEGNTVTFVFYSTVPVAERTLLTYGRANKKSYLFSKGRINEAKHLRASHIVKREKVPGPYSIELVSVRLVMDNR